MFGTATLRRRRASSRPERVTRFSGHTKASDPKGQEERGEAHCLTQRAHRFTDLTLIELRLELCERPRPRMRAFPVYR